MRERQLSILACQSGQEANEPIADVRRSDKMYARGEQRCLRLLSRSLQLQC